jgi:hypothetical protein
MSVQVLRIDFLVNPAKASVRGRHFANRKPAARNDVIDPDNQQEKFW